jgi:hypothetical protein
MGAAGAMGLINNGFTVETISGATITISNTDTHNQFIVTNAVNNNANVSNTVTLPASAVVGAGYIIELNVANWGDNDGTFNVATQSTDTIIDQTFGPFSNFGFNYQAELVTDGKGHWYILINN